jgi:beta-1,4-N-acetylglucosaminyltransferase
MGSRERRTVFVTVGTTCFDALVQAVDSNEVKEALLQKGYTNLLIQKGRGTYMPSKVHFSQYSLDKFLDQGIMVN